MVIMMVAIFFKQFVTKHTTSNKNVHHLLDVLNWLHNEGVGIGGVGVDAPFPHFYNSIRILTQGS